MFFIALTNPMSPCSTSPSSEDSEPFARRRGLEPAEELVERRDALDRRARDRGAAARRVEVEAVVEGPEARDGRRVGPGVRAERVELVEQAVDAEAAALLRGSSSDVQLAVMGEGAVHGVNPSACLVSRVLRLKKLANAGALPRPQY